MKPGRVRDPPWQNSRAGGLPPPSIRTSGILAHVIDETGLIGGSETIVDIDDAGAGGA